MNCLTGYLIVDGGLVDRLDAGCENWLFAGWLIDWSFRFVFVDLWAIVDCGMMCRLFVGCCLLMGLAFIWFIV